MCKSQRLRLHDVRDVFRLVNECCELGADPLAWRQHMVERLTRLLNADIASYGEGVVVGDHGAPGWLQHTMAISFGWPNESDRAIHDGAYRDGMMELIPWFSAELYREFFYPSTRFTTVARPGMYTNCEWDRSEFFQQLLKPSHCNEWIFASHSDRRGASRGLVLLREPGAQPFEARHHRLLSLFFREHARYFGTKLAPYPAPSVLRLAPRLRDTLAGLVRGESEKEIARRLRISPHTVHEHVKRLHRNFGVSSRGELLAHCSRFRPVLDAFASREAYPLYLVDPTNAHDRQGV